MSLPDTRATSGGGDRIAWLHDTLGVSPEALARWILHMYASDRIPDDFFTSKPPTFPQELLFGDDVLTVIGAMMMLPMAPENKTRLRANRESYCKQLSSMPPVRKFPGGFWTRCTIEHFLRGCDAITTTLKIKDTVHRSSIKLVGAVDSARFVAPSAVVTTVPMRIAEKIGQEYCPCALIVYGESGSGKTTAMLLAAVAMDWLWQRPTPFVVYLNPNTQRDRFREIEAICDAEAEEKTVGPADHNLRAYPREHTLANGAVWKRERLIYSEKYNLAELLIVNMICDVFPTYATGSTQPYHAVIVIDELESFPGFVRTVCELGDSFRAQLAALMLVLTVRIVMGGTGRECPRGPVGSLLPDFMFVQQRRTCGLRWWRRTKGWPRLTR